MTLGPAAPLGLGYACFAIAWLLHLAGLARRDAYLGWLGTWVQAAGLVLWVGGLVWQFVAAGTWLPNLQLRDIALWWAPASVAVLLLLERQRRVRAVPAVALIIVLVVGGLGLLAPEALGPALPISEFRGVWQMVYLGLAVVGYSALAVTGAVGVMALARLLPPRWGVADRLPPEDALARLARRNVSWSLLVLTLALAAGATGSWLRDGQVWSWAAGQVWMLAVWATYGALLHFGPFRAWPIAGILGLILIRFGAVTLLR
jgi:hypothetical protein